MKKRDVSLFLLFLFFACILFYPSFSSFWNLHHQAEEAISYDTLIQDISQNDIDTYRKQAEAYNEALIHPLIHEDTLQYEDILNVCETMASIEIPAIDLLLPVYHGCEKETLQKGIGHLEGTSLPTGGKGTHCVLTGHTGLPGVPLFTDLTKLKEGNIFIIHVLNESLTYVIDQIKVVEPDDLSDLTIRKDQDYITLITCTPYGVNDHRLLVRGTRKIINEEEITSENIQEVSLSAHEIIQYTAGIFAFFLMIRMITLIKS